MLRLLNICLSLTYARKIKMAEAIAFLDARKMDNLAGTFWLNLFDSAKFSRINLQPVSAKL